jgi:hypothetical protein
MSASLWYKGTDMDFALIGGAFFQKPGLTSLRAEEDHP